MFLKDFECGRVEASGWPSAFAAYKVAKAAVNAYSMLGLVPHWLWGES